MKVSTFGTLRRDLMHVDIERAALELFDLSWLNARFLLQFTQRCIHEGTVHAGFAMAARLEPALELVVPQKQHVLQAMVDQDRRDSDMACGRASREGVAARVQERDRLLQIGSFASITRLVGVEVF